MAWKMKHTAPCKDGGIDMSKTLDIDLNPSRWADAFSNYEDDKEVICPICNSNDIEVLAACGPDLVGFIAFTCNGCGKTGHISRVKFKSFKDGMTIFQNTGSPGYSEAV